MINFTHKQLVELVSTGAAIDITEGNCVIRENLLTKECFFTTIGKSHNQYGTNGALFLGSRSKQLYAITARSSALFLFI